MPRRAAVTQRPPLSQGQVPPASLRWARLNYSDGSKLWHALRGGVWSICGQVAFDHPRAEYSQTKPVPGKLCKLCVAKLERAG